MLPFSNFVRPQPPQGDWLPAYPVLMVAGAVLVALAILIAVSPSILLYDGRYDMESSFYLAAHFDLAGPLRTPLDLAAGPLYPWLHVLLKPLTGLQLPAVRYVNWAALVAVLGCSWRTLAQQGHRDASAPRGVQTEGVGDDGPPRFDTTGDRSLVVFDRGDEITVQAGDDGIRFLLVSGTPLEEPVAWHGPIVMNTRAELQQAITELNQGTFIKHP